MQWRISWAYATRRAVSLEAARAILLEAVARSPEVATYHFNLACYECQLGDLDSAKARLQRAIELHEAYRLRALEDEDLMPLWNSL